MKLVDLETAKALQELGYDGEYQYCHICTQHDGWQLMTTSDCEKHAREIVNLYAAPRLDDATYWIKDNHRLVTVITPTPYATAWVASLWDVCDIADIMPKGNSFDSFEDALEADVKKAIKTIKDRQ